MGTTARRKAISIGTALVAFVGSLIAFDRAASATLDAVYRWAEGRSQLREKLAALPDKPSYQVLVLGTSRTFEAIHPSAIEAALGVKAYKEASRGKGLRYAHAFYGLYREVVGKPRVVVYGVDYFVFGMPSEEGLLRRFDEAAPAAPRQAWVPLLTLARKDANDRAIARVLERVQQRVLSAMGEFDPEHDQRDMAAYTGRRESRVVVRPEPARYERARFAPFPGPEGEYLLRLLDLWAADGVRVMFVYPPDYVASRRTNVEHDAFVAEFRRVIAGAPRAAFFDYDDPARFPVADPSLFWDGGYGNSNSHLSQRGAAVFARLYIPDLARVLAAAR